MGAAVFGTSLAGGVAVTLSTFSTPAELDHLLRDSGVSVLLFERAVLAKDFAAILAELEPEIRTAAPGALQSARYPFLRHLAMVGEAVSEEGIDSWNVFLERGRDEPHQCFGCASFSSDPSYLPEMRRRLLDLKAIRARVDAFDGAAEWAKRDARPSDEEIEALRGHIHTEEGKLAHATSEQRALIDNASATLRKVRAIAQVDITLRRRENGQDALMTHINDRRHIIDAVGQLTND